MLNGFFSYFKLKKMNNKFKEGEVVFAKINPELKLVVRRYIDQIYYCKVQGDPGQKEHVYFERELMDRPNSTES